MAVVIPALPAAAGLDIPPWVAGLRAAVHIDSSGGSRATSWGTTMELVGAYLDDQSTIVMLKGNDVNVAPGSGYLTASGHRYNLQQGVSYDDGYDVLKFGPVPGALSSSLAVSLRLVDAFALPPHVWTLAFAIGPRILESQSDLAPGRVGNMTITFNSVSAVPGPLAVRFTEVGLTYDQVLGPVQVSKSGGHETVGRGPFTVRVQTFDPVGKPLLWLDTELSPAADGSASVRISNVFLRTGPGPYKIVITGPDGDSLERIVATDGAQVGP